MKTNTNPKMSKAEAFRALIAIRDMLTDLAEKADVDFRLDVTGDNFDFLAKSNP